MLPIFAFGQELSSNLNTDDDHEHHDHEHHDHNHSQDSIAPQVNDTLYVDFEEVYQGIDFSKSINFWKITERTGEIIKGSPDTLITDYFNRTNMEGYGVSVAYLGNLGSPIESRIFSERKDRSQFMFFDPYWAYAKKPDNFHFINTKTPYSNISYQRAGSRTNMEERLQGMLAVNMNKKLNIGLDIDYLYARGFYNSQGTKHLDWSLFGNYISDRHQVHAFLNAANYVNAENGGITDDLLITHPEINNRPTQTKDISTNIYDTWNRISGNQVYLNYRYNLGFYRDTDIEDEEGNMIKRFHPVASLSYTGHYDDKKRKYYTNNTSQLNSYYNNELFLPESFNPDTTSYWTLKNTIALSMREGFSKWAKFNLTAYINHETRSFNSLEREIIYPQIPTSNISEWSLTSIDTIAPLRKTNQNSTYIGGELSKKNGKILRYDAQGSFGVLGYNLGDINISGHVETRIPIFKDTASIDLIASIKNIAPTFYENHYHSKYFWWDKDFNKVQKLRLGGLITIPHTKTKLGINVENVSNYIYFDDKGLPQQNSGSIQVLEARLEQNFHYKILHWDNQLVYQTSSNQDVIPLPDFA
ncbi:putative porin, partial [Bacteroidales bacterium OttesenSCG-928-I14]|nr:putative porin [Bacteroidales bacterium OttesenSCG-928-I14]